MKVLQKNLINSLNKSKKNVIKNYTRMVNSVKEQLNAGKIMKLICNNLNIGKIDGFKLAKIIHKSSHLLGPQQLYKKRVIKDLINDYNNSQLINRESDERKNDELNEFHNKFR